MERKKWTPKDEVSPELQLIREKRKWQIAFRRYVIDKSAAPFYAPYFGLDVENIRKWFENQFVGDMNWAGFGKSWYFEHVLPFSYFDFDKNEDLRLCWHFTNIKVAAKASGRKPTETANLNQVKKYFTTLQKASGIKIPALFLEKIAGIEAQESFLSKAQEKFLTENNVFLEKIEGFGMDEFSLLNGGRSLAEIEAELKLIKNYGGQ